MRNLRWIVIPLLALALSCNDPRELKARELYNVAKQYQLNNNFDKAVEILQNILQTYDGTKAAAEAENLISAIREMENIQYKAKRDETYRTFMNIALALENYKFRFSQYPSNKEDLEILPKNSTYYKWEDDWGQPIYFKSFTSEPEEQESLRDSYVLASFGKDGLPGGKGLDGDLFYQNGEEVDQIAIPNR